MPKSLQKSIKQLSTKIYSIRGQQVMLDCDLAEIYGYSTSAFNQQVTRNIDRFDDDFMFQITSTEYSILKSHFVISNNGRGGNRHLPYAFTEQGIYMLMTVLKGKLAINQSKTLIRMFKSMKDYIIENQEHIEYRNSLQLALKTAENTDDIIKVKTELTKLDTEIKNLNKKLNNAVTKSEISPIIFDFNKTAKRREFLFLNGQLAKASDAYIDIYSQAEHNIYIIDNYVSLKTLRHFCKIRPKVRVIIFTDNMGNYLHKNDYDDFVHEFPQIKIRFIRTNNQIHDRFIVRDYNKPTETIYHCGASEKDAGNKITTISLFDDLSVKNALHSIINKLKLNQELILK